MYTESTADTLPPALRKDVHARRQPVQVLILDAQFTKAFRCIPEVLRIRAAAACSTRYDPGLLLKFEPRDILHMGSVNHVCQRRHDRAILDIQFNKSLLVRRRYQFAFSQAFDHLNDCVVRHTHHQPLARRSGHFVESEHQPGILGGSTVVD